MNLFIRLFSLALVLSLPVRAAFAQSFTPELFNQFVEMRVGTGEPVYWYCIGELYSYPDGKLLAKVEGIDTARLVKSETRTDRAMQISRKIFVYRDPTTNEVLKAVNGKPVQHIEYPYQQITYALRDGALSSTVVQGSGARVQTIGPVGGATARRLGDGILFATPLFLNLDTPRGKYEAYENYDFWVNAPRLDFSAHPSRSAGASRYQLSWNRFGDMPPFFGQGRSVTQLVSYRVANYSDLPAAMRAYLETSARLWMQPPRDLEEIRQLQKGAPQISDSSNER
jgi:hypothetical protein